MKSLNIPFFCCVFFIAFYSKQTVLAQCQSSVVISKLTSSSVRDDGQVEIKITTAGTYDIKLLAVETSGEKNIQSASGSGTRLFSFTKLRNEVLYKIVVDFYGEEKFLCKQKVLNNIFLTDKK